MFVFHYFPSSWRWLWSRRQDIKAHRTTTTRENRSFQALKKRARWVFKLHNNTGNFEKALSEKINNTENCARTWDMLYKLKCFLFIFINSIKYSRSYFRYENRRLDFFEPFFAYMCAFESLFQQYWNDLPAPKPTYPAEAFAEKHSWNVFIAILFTT